MHSIVVSESVYGNTTRIAEAIAEGLSRHGTVEVFNAGDAPHNPLCDLLVVGGPTHAFSMSTASSRRQAVQKQGAPALVNTGIRDYLSQIDLPPSQKAATFDTKIAPRFPGSAAKAAMRRLKAKGCVPSARPQTFRVSTSKGPLPDGEVERGISWGEKLATSQAG